jgi:hypothetical protein
MSRDRDGRAAILEDILKQFDSIRKESLESKEASSSIEEPALETLPNHITHHPEDVGGFCSDHTIQEPIKD